MSRTLKIIIAAIIAIVLTAGLLYVKLRKEQGASPANTNTASPVGSKDAPITEPEIIEALSTPAIEQPVIDENEITKTSVTEQPEISEQEIIDALSIPAK